MSPSDDASATGFAIVTSVRLRARVAGSVGQCCLMLREVLSFNLMETGDPQAHLDDAERRIGRNLRRIREALELTQQDVAERLREKGHRFHQTQIAKIERGERPLRVNEWLAIAEVLKIDAHELMAAGEGTDDRLFMAKLHYERSRQVVDDVGVKLHEVGHLYEEALLAFKDARDYYRQVAEEFGKEFEDPEFLRVHEAAERLAKAIPTKDYAEPALEVLDDKRDRSDYREAPFGSERFLRDGTSY